MFANKRILITGGTGSFGTTVVRALLEQSQAAEVVVFSRDEKKQYEMRLAFPDKRLTFVIGDVRDRDCVHRELRGADYIFHAAALKHVTSCEFFPQEAVKTNVLGTANVLDAAEAHGVEKVVVLSTDKAVYPVNAMGMSKAMMEKVMLAKARSTRSRTVFCAVRYGNVMYSRGSVIPLFVRQIKAGKPLTVTNPDMTRFLLSLPEAVGLVFHALAHGAQGDLFVRKSPASTIGDLAEVCRQLFHADNPIQIVGKLEGEKLHETLLTHDELLRAEESEEFYRVRSTWLGNYERYENYGAPLLPNPEYTSENTRRLTQPELLKLVKKLEQFHQTHPGADPEALS
jgi:UDP-glucose 4-epimerase